MKGFVRKSLFMPGLPNAEDVALQKGLRIKYSCKAGIISGIVQHDDLRQHANGCYGYEVLFDDDGQLGFADERRIVDWEGKV